MKLSGGTKLLFFAFVAAFAVFTAACGGDDDGDSAPVAQAPTFPAGSAMDAIVKRGKLIVGVKFDVPLFGLLDPTTRKVDGFDIVLGKEIGKAMGLREDQVEFIEAVTANRIPFLLEDRADIVISTFTITAQRKEQIDFSRPYYRAGQRILLKRDNNTIRSVTDLNGKRVCSQAGSTSEQNVIRAAPQAEMLPLQVISACVQAMKDGRVDAVSTDDVQLSAFAAVDRDLKVVGEQFSEELYGVGVKKGKPELVQFINDEIAKMLADGRWEKTYTQFLGPVEGMTPAAQAKSQLPATS